MPIWRCQSESEGESDQDNETSSDSEGCQPQGQTRVQLTPKQQAHFQFREDFESRVKISKLDWPITVMTDCPDLRFDQPYFMNSILSPVEVVGPKHRFSRWTVSSKVLGIKSNMCTLVAISSCQRYHVKKGQGYWFLGDPRSSCDIAPGPRKFIAQNFDVPFGTHIFHNSQFLDVDSIAEVDAGHGQQGHQPSWREGAFHCGQLILSLSCVFIAILCRSLPTLADFRAKLLVVCDIWRNGCKIQRPNLSFTAETQWGNFNPRFLVQIFACLVWDCKKASFILFTSKVAILENVKGIKAVMPEVLAELATIGDYQISVVEIDPWPSL